MSYKEDGRGMRVVESWGAREFQNIPRTDPPPTKEHGRRVAIWHIEKGERRKKEKERERNDPNNWWH